VVLQGKGPEIGGVGLRGWGCKTIEDMEESRLGGSAREEGRDNSRE
jgi:hypothetical protein